MDSQAIAELIYEAIDNNECPYMDTAYVRNADSNKPEIGLWNGPICNCDFTINIEQFLNSDEPQQWILNEVEEERRFLRDREEERQFLKEWG